MESGIYVEEVIGDVPKLLAQAHPQSAVIVWPCPKFKDYLSQSLDSEPRISVCDPLTESGDGGDFWVAYRGLSIPIKAFSLPKDSRFLVAETRLDRFSHDELVWIGLRETLAPFPSPPPSPKLCKLPILSASIADRPRTELQPKVVVSLPKSLIETVPGAATRLIFPSWGSTDLFSSRIATSIKNLRLLSSSLKEVCGKLKLSCDASLKSLRLAGIDVETFVNSREEEVEPLRYEKRTDLDCQTVRTIDSQYKYLIPWCRDVQLMWHRFYGSWRNLSSTPLDIPEWWLSGSTFYGYSHNQGIKSCAFVANIPAMLNVLETCNFQLGRLRNSQKDTCFTCKTNKHPVIYCSGDLILCCPGCTNPTEETNPDSKVALVFKQYFKDDQLNSPETAKVLKLAQNTIASYLKIPKLPLPYPEQWIGSYSSSLEMYFGHLMRAIGRLPATKFLVFSQECFSKVCECSKSKEQTSSNIVYLHQKDLRREIRIYNVDLLLSIGSVDENQLVRISQVVAPHPCPRNPSIPHLNVV